MTDQSREAAPFGAADPPSTCVPTRARTWRIAAAKPSGLSASGAAASSRASGLFREDRSSGDLKQRGEGPWNVGVRPDGGATLVDLNAYSALGSTNCATSSLTA